MKGMQAIKCLEGIEELLSSGNAIEVVAPDSPIEKISTKFFGSDNQSEISCVILRAFLHDRTKCIERINNIFGDIREGRVITGLAAKVSQRNSLWEAIRLRAAHVLLMSRIHNENYRDIENELDHLLVGYQKQFSVDVWHNVGDFINGAVGSSDISVLNPWFEAIKEKNGSENLIKAFVEIASRNGRIPAMINPAFFFLLHSTIVLLSGDILDSDGSEEDWDIGTAWGVTAVEDSAVIKKTGFYGSVFKLSVRESLIGSAASQSLGIPYPCPVNGAYLRFDKYFQRGVMNAWLLNRKFEKSCENVVYSLDPFCDPEFEVAARSSRLVGDSMGAAFGIAFRSKNLRQRLRDDAVCSCSINFEGTYNCANDNLSPVGAVALKMNVIDIFEQMNTDHKRQIKIFYVAQKEDEFGLPKNVELRKDICHFSVLYDCMTLNEKLIEEFCQNRSERWMRIGGRDPYQE